VHAQTVSLLGFTPWVRVHVRLSRKCARKERFLVTDIGATTQNIGR